MGSKGGDLGFVVIFVYVIWKVYILFKGYEEYGIFGDMVKD